MSDDREATVADLKADEGVVLHAYADSLGYTTIGVGRLIDQRRGGGISMAESDFLLSNDIDARIVGLVAAYPWFVTLDPVRQSAFVNLAFNLGLEGLAKFHTMLRAAGRNEWGAAVKALRESLWFRQVQPDRSGRILRMLRTGAR